MATTYTVKSGDTLNKIAAQYGFSNYKTAGISGYGANPDLIRPGQVLTIGSYQSAPAAAPIPPPAPPPPVVTPQAMTPTQPTQVVQPRQPTTYPVASLPTAPIQPTAQEQKISEGNSRLGKLYDSLVGKSAYQNEQDSAFGVDTANRAVQDLNAKLTGIKNEAAAIPLQLQQGAADRGVTTPQLGAQQNSRLRTNSIAALGASTLLAASQGQLANAQALADKAVAAKYDPILEQINALKANLGLIINDPQTSLQDKNRAQAQLDTQNAKAQEVAQAKATATEVWDIATQSASNGNNFKPSGQYTNLSTTLQAISDAPTKEQALQIAVATGLAQTPQSASVTAAQQPHILGSAATGYFSFDPVSGKSTPVSGPGGTPPGTPPLPKVGDAIKDAEAAITRGADPEAVRKAFLNDYPTGSASWNSYFGVSTPASGYPKPASEPAPAKSGLFGWGFLGL